MKKIITTKPTKEKTIQRPSIYNEMKNEIFVFFSLLLDLANKYLRGKEEDLNKTNKGESHAETEHTSDVGNESRGRHHLKRELEIKHNIILFTSSVRYLER